MKFVCSFTIEIGHILKQAQNQGELWLVQEFRVYRSAALIMVGLPPLLIYLFSLN